MLWNLIFDFYVTYIFGGISSDYDNFVGFLGYDFLDTDAKLSTDSVYFTFSHLLNGQNGEPIPMCLGNYFSLIATIITMVIILLVIGHFIKKTFNLFGRII